MIKLTTPKTTTITDIELVHAIHNYESNLVEILFWLVDDTGTKQNRDKLIISNKSVSSIDENGNPVETIEDNVGTFYDEVGALIATGKTLKEAVDDIVTVKVLEMLG